MFLVGSNVIQQNFAMWRREKKVKPPILYSLKSFLVLQLEMRYHLLIVGSEMRDANDYYWLWSFSEVRGGVRAFICGEIDFYIKKYMFFNIKSNVLLWLAR